MAVQVYQARWNFDLHEASYLASYGLGQRGLRAFRIIRTSNKDVKWVVGKLIIDHLRDCFNLQDTRRRQCQWGTIQLARGGKQSIDTSSMHHLHSVLL